jgi:hypothetical protein
MGFFDKFLPGSKTKEVSTLSPEQQRVQRLLGTTLEDRLGAGPQQFEGQLTAPITAGEESVLARNARLSALSEGTLSDLINIDPAALDARFRREVVTPTFETFRTETAPLIQESLPTFSTARGRAIERATGNLQNQLLQARFGATESARNRALQAIQSAQDLARTEAQIQSVPRVIEQAGLDRDFLNFTQANQQFSSDINSALGFLNIGTKAQISEPNTSARLLGTLLAFSSGGRSPLPGTDGGGTGAGAKSGVTSGGSLSRLAALFGGG